MGESYSTLLGENPYYTFNILVLDSTNQICKYVNDERHPWSYELDGKRIHVYFAVHAEYCSTVKAGFSFCRKFDGIIIAQDYTKKQLDTSKLWVEKINRYASTDACKLFVGVSNDDESDKAKNVQRTTVENYADANGFPFMDISMSQTKWQYQVIMKVLDDVYWKKSQLQNAEQRK